MTGGLSTPDSTREEVFSAQLSNTKVTFAAQLYYDTRTITLTAYDGPDAVCTTTVPAWDSHSLGGSPFREAYAGGVFSPRGWFRRLALAEIGCFTRLAALLRV